MLFILICAVAAVVCAFPEGAVARRLRAVLVEAPARFLGRMSVGRWVVFLLVSAAIFGAMVWLRDEGLAVLGPVAGEGLGALAAFDFGALIDTVAVAVLVAANVRLRGTMERARRLAGRAWAITRTGLRRRRRRVRGTGSRRPSGKADEWPGAAWA